MSSTFPGSASASNFLATAGIPPTLQASASEAGMCATNVDGACIRGGVKVAGSSGYALASLGGPTAHCTALGMFAGGNKPYALWGWEARPNLNMLRDSTQMI